MPIDASTKFVIPIAPDVMSQYASSSQSADLSVHPLSDKELARLNVTSLLLPNTHPLAYYLTGPYGDLAQAIIDGQKRLDVLEAKHAPVQDSQMPNPPNPPMGANDPDLLP